MNSSSLIARKNRKNRLASLLEFVQDPANSRSSTVALSSAFPEEAAGPDIVMVLRVMTSGFLLSVEWSVLQDEEAFDQ